MKRFLLITVILIVTICGTCYAFNDVSSTHWAKDAINNMQSKGILNGYEDGNFLPENNITREEFVKILVKSLNLSGDTLGNIKFKDIEDDRWSKEYIEIAGKYLTAYKSGTKYYFKPTEYAVREEIIVATVMALNLQDENVDLSVLDRFSDKDLISNNMQKYVAIAVKNDLIHGNTDGTLNPLGKLTRAEVSQVMYNIMKKLESDEINKIAINDDETEGTMILSANKEDGSVLNKTDKIKLTVKNVDTKLGEPRAVIFVNGECVYTPKIENGDTIKVAEIISRASAKGIHEIESIELDLRYDSMIETECKLVARYVYSLNTATKETVVLSANKENRSSLYGEEKIKLTAKNIDTKKGSPTVEIYVNSSKISTSTYKNGDIINVAEIIANLSGDMAENEEKFRTMKLFLYFDNTVEDKIEGATEYIYYFDIEETVEEEVLYGDVNDDGKVNSKDRLILARHIAGMDTTTAINKEAADLNQDGKLDDIDRAILSKNLAGWGVTLPYDSGKSYSITYDLDGGKVDGWNAPVYAQISLPYTLTNPTKDGYTFEGWTSNLSSEKQLTVTIPEGTTGNLTFKANFAKIKTLLRDVNDDGEVTVTDMVRLIKYVNGENVTINEGNSDLNNDGKIDNEDLEKFTEYFANLSYDPLYGDANGDGKVTEDDSTLILHYSLLPDLYEIATSKENVDVDEDGSITSDDAIIVKAYVNGKINILPHTHEFINNKCACGIEK